MTYRNQVILFVILCLPFFVFADVKTYQNEQGFMQMLGDYITDFWTFFDTDVPSLFQRMYAWVLQKALEIKIYGQIESMKFAWGVSKEIINNMQIGSKITAQISTLDPDTKQFLIDFRIVDGINLIVQAYIAKFVMRFSIF